MASLGVDIGGTKIAAGVVNEFGDILFEIKESTPSGSASKIDQLVAKMYKACKESYPIEAIGISAAGFVSQDRKTVAFSPNIVDWVEYPLAENISNLIKNEVKVIIENDANCAGWAEYQFGAAKGKDDMIMLTLGTGLGGAIVSNGRLLRGHNGAAGELGHVRVVPHGQYCGCGLRGCWEQYASGMAMMKHAKSRATIEPESAKQLLKLANGDINNITGELVTEASRLGDKLSIEMINTVGKWVGEGLGAMVSALDPEIIVIGGGMVGAGEMLLSSIRGAFRSHLFGRGHRTDPEVVYAKFGNNSGIIGAAGLAWEKI
ncbi:MAG: ROK family glucokinase [Bifidobacteriaceae bacterium]|jgi:glucokinase|nr:ROK family glucokinase [Bifidobacteriaceae bacterium]